MQGATKFLEAADKLARDSAAAQQSFSPAKSKQMMYM